MATKSAMKVWQAYDDACKRLIQGLPDNPDLLDFDEIARKVIFACEGMGGAAWIELDERQGYRDLGNLFAYVRQTRNSPAYGPALFKAVNRKVPGRAWGG
jgi:hypothetical protein